MPHEETFGLFKYCMQAEVIELSPSKYIQALAAMNVRKVQWKESRFAQNYHSKRRTGLKDEHGLQSYVIKRIDNIHYGERPCRMIGWG